MVLPEFKEAISNHNLLRARIILKDSLIVDPTFARFDEMLSYAERQSSSIIVPFDGGRLEEDPSKWDQDLMSVELVQLVNNFSKKRVDHLKRVISQVMVSNIQPRISEQKRENRKKALGEMASAGRKIKQITIEVSGKKGNRWSKEDIERMEEAAKKIVSSIEQYKNNK